MSIASRLFWLFDYRFMSAVVKFVGACPSSGEAHVLHSLRTVVQLVSLKKCVSLFSFSARFLVFRTGLAVRRK